MVYIYHTSKPNVGKYAMECHGSSSEHVYYILYKCLKYGIRGHSSTPKPLLQFSPDHYVWENGERNIYCHAIPVCFIIIITLSAVLRYC